MNEVNARSKLSSASISAVSNSARCTARMALAHWRTSAREADLEHDGPDELVDADDGDGQGRHSCADALERLGRDGSEADGDARLR